ncbi:CBM96 family carbohydrate-binding protein [Niabella hibiscisoli]|uniref:CBM96 family carbohydrate-binding protein n=1 Tax=Niabella hibiscisoli TaxID=1825928 RepID=UPI001F0CECBB|nr:DNRLRE domain-containing protein [Niabella hibiscisoli]MCH5718145.1 DNRLRE domain-containing protein [Niabella hibiscisoli]
MAYCKKDSPGYQRESYLKFDLSGLPASAFNMGSATLRLTGGVTGPDTANAKWVYYATASKQWTENGITWNNAPRDGQQIGEVPGTIKTTGSTVDFNIPQSVMQAAWQSDKILSIRIIMQPRNSSVPGSFYSDFASKEATNTTYKPQLLFNYAELEAPGYVPNIVMDEITYDSILLDLIASGSARYLISTQVTTKANQALTATPRPPPM